jgi:hypothetical protein
MLENYKTLIDRAVARNIIIYDPKAPIGQVTPKLIEYMIKEIGSYPLTDIYVRGEYLSTEIFNYILPRSVNINWHIYSNKVWDEVEEYCFERANNLRGVTDVAFIIGICNENSPLDCELNKETFKVILGSY